MDPDPGGPKIVRIPRIRFRNNGIDFLVDPLVKLQTCSLYNAFSGEEETGFIGPLPPCETVPVGGNTTNQLPQRRYILVSGQC
jgi:hypothetical protein